MSASLAQAMSAVESLSAIIAAGTAFLVVLASGSGLEMRAYIRGRAFWILLPGLGVFVLANLIQAWMLSIDLEAVSGGPRNPFGTWSTYLGSTEAGGIWILRMAVAILAILMLSAAVRPRRMCGQGKLEFSILLGCTGFLVGSSALAGHYVGGGQSFLYVGLHSLHLLATALWVGALPIWIMIVAKGVRVHAWREQAFRLVAQFSKAAIGLVTTAIVSGLLLADVFVGNQGDLLGTEWGRLLAVKSVLILAALAAANSLRKSAAAGDQDAFFRRTPAPFWYAVAECFVLIIVIALAASMSVVTPATHDQPYWPLHFRASLDAISTDKNLLEIFWVGVILVVSALIAVIVRRRLSGAVLGTSIWLVVAAVGAGISVWAAAVPASNDTYKRSGVPYLAESVAAGIDRYMENCVACHGAGGKGDGPLSNYAMLPPADLSAPHTALHTAGDIYHWIGNGMPSGAMPGFSNAIDDDGRWDLVNFLRAFSQGFQARIINEHVAFNKPWLAAPDFYLTDLRGNTSQLKALRGSPVLLVISRECEAAVRSIDALIASVRSDAPEVVLVCRAADSKTGYTFEFWKPQSPDAVIATYALFGRTIDDKGSADRLGVDHAESVMLIDKYGYIRSRHVSSIFDSSYVDGFVKSLADLKREDFVPEPPGDHVH